MNKWFITNSHGWYYLAYHDHYDGHTVLFKRLGRTRADLRLV